MALGIVNFFEVGLVGDGFDALLQRQDIGVATDLEILDAEMRKLSFKGLDLSHLAVLKTRPSMRTRCD